jgi:hypothetical protein
MLIRRSSLQDHFDYYYREFDEFIFPMTIHPDVSGRPHVLLMHERYVSLSLGSFPPGRWALH